MPYYEIVKTLLLILTIFDQLHFSSLVKDVPCIQSRLQPHIIEYCVFLFLLLFVMKNTVTALECSITQHEKWSLPWQLHKTMLSWTLGYGSYYIIYLFHFSFFKCRLSQVSSDIGQLFFFSPYNRGHKYCYLAKLTSSKFNMWVVINLLLYSFCTLSGYKHNIKTLLELLGFARQLPLSFNPVLVPDHFKRWGYFILFYCVC